MLHENPSLASFFILKLLCILQDLTNEVEIVLEGVPDLLQFIIECLQSFLQKSSDLVMLKKKFYLQSADSYMKVSNFEMAKEMIEEEGKLLAHVSPARLFPWLPAPW